MGDWVADRDAKLHALEHMEDAVVPDMVKTFVVYFYRHIREKNGARRFVGLPRFVFIQAQSFS